MATLALSSSLPPPHVAAARALAERFHHQQPVDRTLLRSLFEQAVGASDASGGWSMRDAYDALELAQVLFVLAPECALLTGSNHQVLSALQAFATDLPVQSYRSEEQVQLQQFSTPLPLAFLAGVAGGPVAGEHLLEPSAGNGLLAWPAARAGSRLILNELDPRRCASLRAAFPGAQLTAHDAELIDDLLGPQCRPGLILMNPPFSRSCGRPADRHAAARHLAAALERLAPGGRLVAIMPESFSEAGTGRQFRGRLGGRAALRLDALIEAGTFAKQGTSVAVRLLVYDKAVSTRPPAHLRASSLRALLDLIETMPAREAPHATRAQPTGNVFSLLTGSRERSLVRATVPRGNPAASARELRYQVLDQPVPLEEQVGIYLPYRPSRLRIPGAVPHPTPLVESLAMGSIAAPKPTHVPLLAAGAMERERLSAAQLETLIYAGSAFERDLPGRFVEADDGCRLEPVEEGGSRYRCGYFLGDGTGAGKGRQIAGIILDQWLRGNRRHLWISKNETLLEDARRDWTALGGLPLDIQPLSQWKLGTPIELDAGILFVTYPTLRSGRSDATRLQQVRDWAGAEFDGIIAFDEAHAMANAAGGEGARGKQKGSEQGLAGVRLQNALPRARVLYASATGASDVNNLAYALRLGLWGPATAFADRAQFVDAIRRGGIAAMELVARDLRHWACTPPGPCRSRALNMTCLSTN